MWDGSLVGYGVAVLGAIDSKGVGSIVGGNDGGNVGAGVMVCGAGELVGGRWGADGVWGAGLCGRRLEETHILRSVEHPGVEERWRWRVERGTVARQRAVVKMPGVAACSSSSSL